MNARIDLADGLAEAFHNADMAFLNGVDGVDGEPGDEQDEQPGSAGPAGREEVLVAGRERAGVGDAGGGLLLPWVSSVRGARGASRSAG